MENGIEKETNLKDQFKRSNSWRIAMRQTVDRERRVGKKNGGRDRERQKEIIKEIIQENFQELQHKSTQQSRWKKRPTSYHNIIKYQNTVDKDPKSIKSKEGKMVTYKGS